MNITRRASTVTIVLLSLAILGAGPAQAADTQRLYLLHADSGFNYWAPDPSDPAATGIAFTRRCAEYTGDACGNSTVTPLGYANLLTFLPGGLTSGTLSWDANAPLRFRFALDVVSDVPFTVHALAYGVGLAKESPAAIEIEPGVWEGAIASPATVQPGASLLFGILIRQPGLARPRLSMHIRTAGASWFELSASNAVRSMTQLVTESTYRPSPERFATAERVLTFNDADWEVFSFTGDLARVEEFTVSLPRRAASVMGWFGEVSEPAVYRTSKGNTDARTPIVDVGNVRLRAGTQDLSFARYSASAVNVQPGPLTMRIEPVDAISSHPYTAYLVVIYGDRTLDSFRWRFEVPAAQVRSPVLHAYQGPQQQIPSSREVTTFSISVAAEGSLPAPQAWSIGFDVPGFFAPEAGMSDTRSPLRVVAPGQRLSRMTPTPAFNSITVGIWDTVFEGEVRYAYTAM